MGSLLSVLGIVLLLGTGYMALTSYFSHSPLDNIPGPPSDHWIHGNLKQFFSRTGWGFYSYLNHNYDPVVKFHGILGSRCLYVYDPLALASIVVKDQYVYEETSIVLNQCHLMLGDGLLATVGERHRKQRRMLNPVFSIAHMRHMIPIFYNITHKLQDAIAMRVKDGQCEIDMLDWMGRTALELIGQATLGWSFDPLVENTVDNNLGTAVKSIIPNAPKLRLFRVIVPFVHKLGPPAFRRRMIDFIPSAGLKRMRDISDEIQSHARHIYETKKRAMREGDAVVTQQIGEGKDIMSKLMQANMSANEEDRLPEEELLGQMATFIFGGVDTTSNALARILDLLSKHQDIQHKLRAELLEAIDEHGPELPHDVLTELPYLDAVCRETLRLHPPVPHLPRKVREDIVMPLSQPIRGLDGTLISEIAVPEGTIILIGILASNRNPQVWGPDAEEWKPERWLSPLPATVKEAHVPGVYSHLMTFIGGGRACIGFKFSQLEMKVVLVMLLAKFTFAPSDQEIYWNLAGIQYPTVGNDSSQPQLPMKVGLVKSS
ncbi:cytochrome P450 [Fomitopsis betulina]|nr:cytochrome P450 [Fomitopsis betulina]